MERSAAGTRLATAADELVQAAISESMSGNQLVGKDAAQDITKLLEETKRLVGQVGAAKESSDARLNTATQRLLNLETKVSSIETKVSLIETTMAGTMDKARRIEWAAANVKSIIGPVVNAEIPGYTNPYYNRDQMSAFLLDVLLMFRQGVGVTLPDQAYVYKDGSRSFSLYLCDGTVEEQKIQAMQRFRDTVQSHLHKLLGLKPRISAGSNECYVIWYS